MHSEKPQKYICVWLIVYLCPKKRKNKIHTILFFQKKRRRRRKKVAEQQENIQVSHRDWAQTPGCYTIQAHALSLAC